MSNTSKKHLADHDFIGEIDKQFRSLEQTLSTFRSQITALQRQMRAVEKNTKREMKALKKLADKNRNKGNRKPSGFATPSKISSELCEFMGKENGSEVARTEVTQFVIAYIKEHNLGESKEIKPDDKLRQLLGATDKDTVTYFNLQKYMNRHFPSKNKKAKNVVVSE